MAPVSHLLVYYVTEDGEPISDVITFDVRLLQKQVSCISYNKGCYLFVYEQRHVIVKLILLTYIEIMSMVFGISCSSRFTQYKR